MPTEKIGRKINSKENKKLKMNLLPTKVNTNLLHVAWRKTK